MALGLPLDTDPAVTRFPVATGAGMAEQAQASAFSSIANSAASIGAVFRKRAEEDAARQAQQDFAAKQGETESGKGVFLPERRTFGLELATDNAYNNMMEALTLDRAKKDIGDEAVKLRAKHYGDPEGFEKAMQALAGGYMESAPAELSGSLQLVIDDQVREGKRQAITDRMQADIQEARTAMDAGLEQLVSTMEVLAKDGVASADSPEFMSALEEINDRLDIKANNPLYAYSPDERAIDGDAIADRLFSATLVPEIRKVFDKDGYAAALEAADEMALSLDRDEKGTSGIRTRLRQEANLMQQNFVAGQEARRAQEEAGDKANKEKGRILDQAATRTIYDPKATTKQRIDAVNAASPYITGDRYSTLYRMAVKGPDSDEDGGGVEFARLMQLARSGQLTAEEAFDQGSTAGLGGSKLNQLMEEVDRSADETLRVGTDLIDGAFRQGQFEFSPALAASEAEAKDELRRWRGQNPDAGPNEVANAAREISARRGRRAAAAMVSELNARSQDFLAPTLPEVDKRLQDLEDQARELKESGASLPPGLAEQYQQLEEVKRLLELSDGS